jgi:hypothetical protein
VGIPQTRFVKGEWNAACDECGFVFKASQLRRRWDGATVCKDDYESRHPQDLLRVRPEKKSVPWVRNQQNLYVTDTAYHLADGTYYADGSITADGSTGGPTDAVPVFAVFGPVDPDSL